MASRTRLKALLFSVYPCTLAQLNLICHPAATELVQLPLIAQILNAPCLHFPSLHLLICHRTTLHPPNLPPIHLSHRIMADDQQEDNQIIQVDPDVGSLCSRDSLASRSFHCSRTMWIPP